MGKISALALVVVMMAVVPPAHAEDTGPTISIRFRFPGAVCGGSCPNFEVQVDHDGNVTRRSLWPEGKTTRFKVNDEDYFRFFGLMESLKFGGNRKLDATCKRPHSGDHNLDSLWNPKPDDIEMRWTDSEGTIRVTGCNSNTLLSVALTGALEVLGVDPVFGTKRDD